MRCEASVTAAIEAARDAGHEMELDYIGGILRKWSAEA
jgi:DNA replication protein DnaD